MFVAWRDLLHARGRFALMTSVIALITLLVAFLAALTSGLGRASTSAITDLPADRLVLAQSDGDAEPSFTQSQVTSDQWSAWADVDGVSSAHPLGVAQTRATIDGSTAAVTALGIDGASLSPISTAVDDGEVLLTPDAAKALNMDVVLVDSSLDNAAATNTTVSIGSLELEVVGLAPDQLDYAHTPAVWLSLADWQHIGAHAGGETDNIVATAIALTLTTDADDDALRSAAADLNTSVSTLKEARNAISSFAAENLSLTMMQGFLLVISALVVGVFFTVWTINRGRDIAVIKALGGSTGYLIRDALGQAAVVLILGTTLGAVTATGLGLLLSQVMPVVIDLSTTVLPAALLTLLGVIGALFAIARIGRIDPHAALAAR